MPRVIGLAVVLAVAAVGAWYHRQEARRPIAEAWAAGTDRLA